MKRSLHPLRIGVFVLLGIALLVTAIVVVSGGGLFANTARGVLHFEGSIVGLKSGAPVVMRGVRVGFVTGIVLQPDTRSGGFVAPVQVRLDMDLLGSGGQPGDLSELVQRGLAAQLQAQSLLTGQKLVDLVMLPAAGGRAEARGNSLPAPVAAASAVLVPSAPGVVVIPTLAAAAGWQEQLGALDVKGLGADLSAVAAAARQFVGSAELKKSLADLSQLATSLARVSATLEQQTGPVAQGARATLAEAQQAAKALGQTAERLSALADRAGPALDRVGGAAGRAEALLAPDAPLPRSLQQAAEQIAQSALALRRLAAEDSPTLQGVDSSLQELRRTARAVRELAELLERQPEALLRGKKP